MGLSPLSRLTCRLRTRLCPAPEPNFKGGVAWSTGEDGGILQTDGKFQTQSLEYVHTLVKADRRPVRISWTHAHRTGRPHHTPGPGEHIIHSSLLFLSTPSSWGHSLDSWSHGLHVHSTDEAQTYKGDTRSTRLSLAELEAQRLPVNGQWKTGTSGKAQWLGDQLRVSEASGSSS